MFEIWSKNERASNGRDRCSDPGRNTVTGDTGRLLDVNSKGKHQISCVQWQVKWGKKGGSVK